MHMLHFEQKSKYGLEYPFNRFEEEEMKRGPYPSAHPRCVVNHPLDNVIQDKH